MPLLPVTTGALVAAAGYSSRMGFCKATAKLAGCSSLDRIARSFKEAGVNQILVVTGHWRYDTEKEALSLGCRTVHNPEYAKGMFSSVTAGLGAVPPEWDRFFFLPADMPLIRPSTLRRIMDGAAGPLTCPVFLGKRGHPPLISRALIPRILSWQGRGGLRGALEWASPEFTEVAVSDQGILMDMDSPEDYERLSAMASRRHLPTREEIKALEAMAGTPKRVREHEAKVMSTAIKLADMAHDAGITVDRELLAAGAMLHDLCRTERDHGRAGGAMLRAHGFTALGDLVEDHMDYPYDGKLNEGSLLYLADKITCHDILCSVDRRLAMIEQKFKDDPKALEGAKSRLEKARAILNRLSLATGRDVMEALT